MRTLTRRNNFSTARKMLLGEWYALLNKTSRVTEGPESLFGSKYSGVLAPFLEHLTELYEGSAEGKTKDEKRVVHWLLLKHQGVFSQNKNDLGITNLVEHTIDASDTKPIKQPPLCLPMGICR